MNRVFATLVGLALLFGALNLAGDWGRRAEFGDNALAVGTPVATFRLPDAAGQFFRLPTPGRPILINYWASWCGPCLREMPILQDFARRNGRTGPQVVGIALDAPHDSRAWLADNPQPYPILLESPSEGDSSERLGNRRGLLPFTVLVGADGRVLATRTGPFEDAADLEAFVQVAR
jgi:thiol-disulfide isomerase/thioredoxin